MSNSEIKRVWPQTDEEAQARRDRWRAERSAMERDPTPEIWFRRMARGLFGLKNGAGGLPRRYPGYAHMMRRSMQIRRRELTLDIPGLPEAFDGYRLLHLTDLHLDHLPQLPEKLAGVLDGLSVDLVLLSGDYQENERADPSEIARLVARALAGLEVSDGILGVLGNHDTTALAPALERVGVTMLINEVVEVRRGADRLLVTGTDDVHHFEPDGTADALLGGPTGTRIALMHSPERADLAALHHQLLLAGHTHGGQVCLPGGVPLVRGLKRFRRYAKGLWRHGAMIGYTGNGIGTTVVPIRLNCPGEAVVLTLRR